jgi:hypothetical protein
LLYGSTALLRDGSRLSVRRIESRRSGEGAVKETADLERAERL